MNEFFLYNTHNRQALLDTPLQIPENLTEDQSRWATFLERLCNPLCEAATGFQERQVKLDMLDSANLFVVALDDERQWYRYHHLFAEALRTRGRGVC